MTQFEFVAWLVKWLLSQESFEFDWDSGNSTKSYVKHGIKVDAAEQVFRNRDFLVPLGIQISPSTDEPRFGAFGMDLTGALLFVSFTIRNRRIRVISIRAMNKTERKEYAALREE